MIERNSIHRSMLQEMGFVSVVVVMIANAWLIIANMNASSHNADRLKEVEAKLMRVLKQIEEERHESPR